MAKNKQKKTENDELSEKKTSFLMLAVLFVIITVIAGGAGVGASMFLQPTSMKAQEEKDKAGHEDSTDQHGPEKVQAHGAEPEGGIESTGAIKKLAPILTNLASPKGVWVRMEIAVFGAEEIGEKLAEKVHQDIFSFMRTVKLHHIEGPSGYINLKSELAERAVLSSEGKIEGVLIRTLIFE